MEAIILEMLKLSDYIEAIGFVATKQYNSYQGLYFLYNKEKKLVYIGKAKHIGNRVKQHCKNEEINDYIHFFKFAIVECPVKRDMYETYYINKMKPPLNREKTYTYKSSYNEMRSVDIFEERDELELESELEFAMRNFREQEREDN